MERARTWLAAAAILLCAAGTAQAKDESRVELLAYPPPPASVACADGRASLARADPLPNFWLFTTDQLPFIAGRTVRPAPPEVDVSFDITADGRPHALRETGPGAPFANDALDVDAIIAGTWRFTPGRPFTGCRLRAVALFLHIEDASRSMILAVVGETLGPSTYNGVNAGPRSTTVPSSAMPAFETDIAAFHRILSAPDSTCADAGPLHAQLIRFPERSAVDDPPGARSWAMVDYDIAADGHAANARIAGSSGNASLDAQALAAVSQSTFSGAPRTGCLAVFRHAGPPLAWPQEPPLKEPGSCPVEPAIVAGDIGRFYPETFQQRKVEGWALIQFDVAASGAVGDVKAVRAEPAEAFGEAARQAVMAAGPAPNGHGETGCLVAVAFRFPPAGEVASAAPR